MKKLAPSLIAIAVTLTLYSGVSYAINLPNADSNNPQCLINVPRFDRPLVNDDINTLPVNAEANRFEAIYPNTAIYQGDVFIEQGNRTVQANKVTIDSQDKNNRTVTLEGNITYQDNLIEMKGDNASMNLNDNDTQMSPNEYHLVNRLGRGNADETKLEKNRYIILKNGSFTSCPINDSTWNIKGTTVIHDNDEQLLEVWNAVFQIGKVPVLYSPYLQLPTGDKRSSGLLTPNISYDSIDGIDFLLPIYWNIAPNYDATFTPRVLQHRGIQLQTEFRYLNEIGLGTLAFDWLQNDSQYREDREKQLNGNNYGDNKHRWLFHWENSQLINYNWHFYANTNRVSDNQYLTDLDSKYASETDGYLTQFYQTGYNNENWDITLDYRHFQPLYAEGKDNLYQTQPQLDIHYYNYDLGPLKFKTFSQLSHFVTSGNKKPKAWRTHIEPTFNYTLSNSWATLATEASIMATHYTQDNIKKHNESSKEEDKLDRNVNRYMPKFSIDGKVIFERDTTFIDDYTQTLEPRVKYTYIPYRNQSNIMSYDTTLLQSDYIGLFRDQPYSGLDRIASANNLATGITTRLYNNNKIEKFNFSIGQITYFTKSKTSEHNNELDKNSDTGSITWATDSFWRISDDYIFRSGIQYDTRINKISLANAIIEYRPSNEKLAQLSYRYANKNYIDTIRNNNSFYNPYKQDISQAGIMVAWPLSNTISAVGSYYYDVKLKQTADSFIGLHYSDCCWGVTVQYGRKLTDWDSRESKYKNKLSINFELLGLSRPQDAKAKMLNFGKLPYITTFE